MYLGDCSRTARTSVLIPEVKPKLIWRWDLPTQPVYGVETMADIDLNGNIYFGSHNGSLYSLSESGRFRWSFQTDLKMYASPQVAGDGSIVNHSGDGYLLCIEADGRKRWAFDTAGPKRKPKSLKALFSFGLATARTFDVTRRMFYSFKGWGSPLVANGTVFATGYGAGLSAVRLSDGVLLWQYRLGSPSFHRSGVSMSDAGNLYACSHDGVLHSVSDRGERRWSVDLTRPGHESWSAVAIDNERSQAYVVTSRQERSAEISAVSLSGQMIWRTRIDAGARESVAIGHGAHLYLAALDGRIHKIEKSTGRVAGAAQLANTSRGFWTVPIIDANDNMLVTANDGGEGGRLAMVTADLVVVWDVEIGKALAPPRVRHDGSIVVGSWAGAMFCFGQN